MDTSLESDPKSQDEMPVRSSFGKNFECYVRERYLKKISLVGVYRAAIPSEKFSWECLPPIEVSNLLCYLVFTQISSLRPWKVWICTVRWFLVSLRQFKRKKCCGQRWEIRSELPKVSVATISGKIFLKLLTVKQQTDIQDLTTICLICWATVFAVWHVTRRARIQQLVFP